MAMHIGRIAKKSGVTPDAIRFYERRALLPRASRTAGGFRQYADSDVETLGFIRRVQGLGFTLDEVRELLELRRDGSQPCARVRGRLEQKLSHVRAKSADLKKVEHELRFALRGCRKEMGKRAARCPLLGTTRARKTVRSK
jgi:DNA-binding transcriptional MerR regulator